MGAGGGSVCGVGESSSPSEKCPAQRDTKEPFRLVWPSDRRDKAPLVCRWWTHKNRLHVSLQCSPVTRLLRPPEGQAHHRDVLCPLSLCLPSGLFFEELRVASGPDETANVAAQEKVQKDARSQNHAENSSSGSNEACSNSLSLRIKDIAANTTF